MKATQQQFNDRRLQLVAEDNGEVKEKLSHDCIAFAYRRFVQTSSVRDIDLLPTLNGH